MTDDDVCGAETTDGTPCQHPAGSCPVPSHSDPDADNPHGRPSSFSEQKRDQIYTAVGAGLSVHDIASMAEISPDTLRRWTCCIDNLREGVITADDPCDFCEGYAQAHAEGAMAVIEQCSPEFRASASFGYTKTQEIEHSGEVDLNSEADFSDTST
jgi:hypothetical protein